jgi:hypothetical protein
MMDDLRVSWGRPKQVFHDLRGTSLQRPLLVFTIDSQLLPKCGVGICFFFVSFLFFSFG